MKIRAHHLLCIQGFQRYGYNKQFVENMSKVIKDLELYPNQKIQMTIGCDVFCECCPHKINGICSENPDSEEKIRKMDINVLKILELNENTPYEAKKAFQLVNKRFNTSNIQNICENCNWKNKCLFYNRI